MVLLLPCNSYEHCVASADITASAETRSGSMIRGAPNGMTGRVATLVMETSNRCVGVVGISPSTKLVARSNNWEIFVSFLMKCYRHNIDS